ncbi:hypothetical protein Tco_1349002 [Tanacetum coccineum]
MLSMHSYLHFISFDHLAVQTSSTGSIKFPWQYALTKNPTIYVSQIEKFWQTATVKIVDNGEQEINATVDGKEFTITKASVRRHLQLADVDDISVLPNTKIFDQLTLMGYVLTDDKLTFQKGFSGEHTPLFPSMLALQAEESEGSGNPSEPQPPPSTAQLTHEEPIPNIKSSLPQKTQSPRQALNKDTDVERAATTATSLEAVQDNSNIAKTQSTATPTKLIYQETSSDGGPRRQETMGVPLFKLGLRGHLNCPMIHHLEETKKVYDDDMASEVSSKQGRMIEEIDQDVGVTLVTPTKVSSQEDQPEDQLGVLSAAKVLADAARVHTYSKRRRAVSTGSGGVSTASKRRRAVSTGSGGVSTTSRIVNTAGMIQQVNIIILSSSATKDKGKAIMTESEPEQTTTKLKQRQERVGYEAAIRLQEQLDQEEKNIKARVEANEELTQKLQAEEWDKYSKVDQARMLVDLINKRKRYFATQKAEAKRNKPMTQAQQRTYMSNYIKHMGSHTMQQLSMLSVKKQKLKENDVEKKKLRACLDIVLGDEVAMDFESLATKYPIID